ncbi:NrdH-redoxin [Candidatus Falkowbacteria bacterium CG10_big_fil_rev_8_21_14_0_10_44_15]|uniref:NrdH-redoxin n=1 Tax=Candidatus Falkowbacteria bacterium CG10_big_fil_rev_8_21_14_0_10_44_15 TaxID=1974569 RepID=A0A2H0V0M4_9BACT|nr:MAG: NrdH-redoxin [Candidatus Falkowbacteria bacterium CG10_big_fil_rev_8_21_14_0_10_44_15]
MPSVTIYTTPTCTYCHTAKEYFKQNNIAYIEKDVTQDVAAQQEMIARSGQMGVPVIDVGGTIVVGFAQPKLKALLGLK